MTVRLLPPRLRAAALAAMVLPAACAWPFAETDANGWRYESNTTGDWRTEFKASKGALHGPERLELHCGLSSFRIDRPIRTGSSDPVPAAYRFDDGPWIGTPAIYTGMGGRLDDGPQIDPVRRRLPNAGRLAVVLAPPGEAPVVMEFDLTGADEALRRMREHRTCRAS